MHKPDALAGPGDPAAHPTRRRSLLLLTLASLAPLPVSAQALLDPGAITPDAEATASPSNSAAEPGPLTGQWGGVRSHLADAGVHPSAAYTTDLLATVSGGAQTGAALLHNLDLGLFLDLERLVGWAGGSVWFYGLGNWGESVSHYAGDFQGISNIEAPHAFRLFEAWIRQDLLDGRLSFQAGLFDLNSEFYVTESAGLFIHSSHGIGPEFSQTGERGPSIFPSTAIALRAQAVVAPGLTIRAAVLDAVPGDPADETATGIVLSADEGALLTGEIEIASGGGRDFLPGPARIVVGGWIYSAPFDPVLPSSRPRRGNGGLYAIAEGRILSEAGDRAQGLRAFARAGFADPTLNRVAWSWGAGLVYHGLVPRRPFDELGFAVAEARHGQQYMNSPDAAGLRPGRGEVALECSYAGFVSSWLVVQPDLQYVVRPDMSRATQNAFVAGVRAAISF